MFFSQRTLPVSPQWTKTWSGRSRPTSSFVLWGEDLHAEKTERIPLGTGAKEPFMCRWLESPAGLLAAPKFFLLAEHFCRIGSLLWCQKIQTKQHLVMALWFLGPVSPIKTSIWPGIRSVPSCIIMWVKAWKKASSPKLEKILQRWRRTMKRCGRKCGLLVFLRATLNVVRLSRAPALHVSQNGNQNFKISTQ